MVVSTQARAATGQSAQAVTPAAPCSATGELPWIENPKKVAPKDARSLCRTFFDQLQVLEEGTPEYQYARNTLIEMNLSLVRFAASRYRNRGSGEMEDIVQVGTIGLIKAIDRFDLTREVEFTTFSIPYIVGEIKRYFRDTTWAVHVPRRLQELRVDLARAQEALFVDLGRQPTVRELADHLDLSEEEILDGLIASNGYTAGSLDMPQDNNEQTQMSSTRSRTLADVVGVCDPTMELVEDFHALAPLLHTLDDREREILTLRFGQEMTQSQIGAELGISQMHVSRLLARTLGKLRSGMLTQD
ncbi:MULTISPECIES: RNA polymerase sigma factor SigF [unclassified Streptomyces]|uniref:RNA polymerase sigma factor SigF n=1 Tax=unclassified Streptomyces TaxID=2593676 RepID=UPI002E151D3D|nr:RNA polymerase sigma factor SigF [Streptomyces sp. NBC_01197]WSS52310.1 RNA polymerase sigma factor SigF [Streptomyces sp. NBC_01180]